MGARSASYEDFFLGEETPEGAAGGLPVEGVVGPEPLPVIDRGRAPSEERWGRAPFETGSWPCLSFVLMLIRSLVSVVEPFN